MEDILQQIITATTVYLLSVKVNKVFADVNPVLISLLSNVLVSLFVILLHKIFVFIQCIFRILRQFALKMVYLSG